MAARISGSGALSRQNMVEIEFIDEDDLPIANFVEHRESDDGLDSDFEEEEEEEEGPVKLIRERVVKGHKCWR